MRLSTESQDSRSLARSHLLTQGLHRDEESVLSAVTQNAQTSCDAASLQVDRICCLSIWFQRDQYRTSGWRVNNQLTESTIKSKLKFGVLVQINEAADAAVSCEGQVRQDIVEPQSAHGLSGAEIQSRIDGANLAGR